jgi:hypothetical protein
MGWVKPDFLYRHCRLKLVFTIYRILLLVCDKLLNTGYADLRVIYRAVIVKCRIYWRGEVTAHPNFATMVCFNECMHQKLNEKIL